jgi:AraC family transcriptional regulator
LKEPASRMVSEPRVLFGRKGRVAVLELGADIVEHAHPQMQALLKIEGPDRAIVVAGERYMLRDDSWIQLRPWIPHAGLSSDPVGTRVFAVNLNRPSTDGAGMRAAGGPNAKNICRRFDSQLRAAVDQLKLRLIRGQAVADDADDLLDCVSAACASTDFTDDATKTARMDFRVRRVIERIHTDPVTARNLDACVGFSGLSRPHFFRLFRLCTGLTPRLYANSLRLEGAIDRLINTSMPIHAVSESLGFSAPSHFTRFFLRHLGTSPRAFRQGVYSVAV